ncbi:MAG: hypothetical protein LBF40_11360 [Deltaproteobacteria bacterium]|jgi:hypothetical protein|nr:hypothetical protein [Deltaproteobacteria bacterium]
MFVSSDFLGYLNRKKTTERDERNPLVTAALKTSAGGKEKAPPVEQRTEGQRKREGDQGEVEYLNERPSTLNVIL